MSTYVHHTFCLYFCVVSNKKGQVGPIVMTSSPSKGLLVLCFVCHDENTLIYGEHKHLDHTKRMLTTVHFLLHSLSPKRKGLRGRNCEAPPLRLSTSSAFTSLKAESLQKPRLPPHSLAPLYFFPFSASPSFPLRSSFPFW